MMHNLHADGTSFPSTGSRTHLRSASSLMPAASFLPCASLDAREVLVSRNPRRTQLVQVAPFRCTEGESRCMLASRKRADSSCRRGATVGSGAASAAAAAWQQQQQGAAAQVVQPQEGERELLKKLYRLTEAASGPGELGEVGNRVGLVQASSSASGSGAFQTMTDTFDEYEDMQGVPLMDVKRQDPRSQDPNSFLPSMGNGSEVPGAASSWAARFGAGTGTAPPRSPGPMESTDPAWDDRLPIDASVDGHFEDIDNYGDGAAGMAGQQYGASPALRQAASRMNEVAAAAKATGVAAARAYAQVAMSSSKVAQAAAAALSQQPGAAAAKSRSQWVALDDRDENMRVVVLLAGADAAAAVQRATQDLVPFQGMRNVRISAAVQDEACRLFMQLMPVIVEATEQGLCVCLTGQGAGGSLAGVLALLCAHHGMHSSGFGAVVFDAPPCIGEDAPDEWYEQRTPESTLDEDVVEEILSRGLMSRIGMPSNGVKSVIVHAPGGGAPKDGLVATLGSLAAKMVPSLGLPLVEAALQGDGALAHATVSVLRRLGSAGKQITVFKPLGTVVTLEL